MQLLKVGPEIPHAELTQIRRQLELSHQKWDAQVGDGLALANAPLTISHEAWRDLSELAEALYRETFSVEQELLVRPDLHPVLGMPRRLASLFRSDVPTPSAARIMRFDFHETSEGWRLSEVNSDVPGGYTEATHLTRLVASRSGGEVPGDPTAALAAALATVASGDVVALTCATGFLEDQQVVSCLASELALRQVPTELVSVGQIGWTRGRARLEGNSGKIGAIFRFYQGEWLAERRGDWRHFFVGGHTPCANPGSALLTESKRLPLLWDRLTTPVPTWRRLLPETRELREAPWRTDDAWLIKSAYSNNGDTVSIRAALNPKEWRRRSWRARLQSRSWVAQRRFEVLALSDSQGKLHPCIGVFVVNGRAAGAYARVTRGAFIDFAAQDAALLVDSEV